MLLRRSNIRLVAMLAAVMFFAGAFTGAALAYQSHMWAAKNQLQRAYTQLQAAVPDKAGHRKQAMTLVQQAINEVNLGIAAGAH
jgi:hypothetical protein